jgi:PKD repeat protein
MRRRIAWGLLAGLALILVITGCWFLGNLNPIAGFTATPSSGPSTLSVTFDAAGSWDPDGTIAEYYWDFGDGQTASQITYALLVHVYTNVQSDSVVFTAILTVTDNLGAEDSACKNITVNP